MFWTENMTIIFISTYCCFKKACSSHFDDIIKIINIFIKKIFKDSRKIKKNQKLCIKMEFISTFLDITKFGDLR